jgi:SAM-dependent methyltransferase
MALSLVSQQVDVAFYARQAERCAGPVLVLGCANGRVVFELLSKGIKVVGVDPSERMIASAEERRAELDEGSDGVRFHAADLRSLRLNERFAAVFAPQNAIGLMGSLGDLGSLLATVRHHLMGDGALVFDVANPNARRVMPPQREDELEPPGLVEPIRPVFAPHLRERRRSVKGDAESIRRLKLRPFEPREIDSALNEAGFDPMERFGDFEGKPFDEQDPIQVVVAAPR